MGSLGACANSSEVMSHGMAPGPTPKHTTKSSIAVISCSEIQCFFRFKIYRLFPHRLVEITLPPEIESSFLGKAHLRGSAVL